MQQPFSDDRPPLPIILLGILAIIGISGFLIIQVTNQPPWYLLIGGSIVFVSSVIKRLKKDARKPTLTLIAQCLLLASIIFLHSRQPYGTWDAWAQWTPKALFLGVGTQQWKAVFSDKIEYMHPGYPLLSPTLKALIGTNSEYFYEFSIIISSLVSWLYLLMCGDLLYVTSNKRLPALVGNILALIPGLVPWIASQYSDIFLGCFIAGALTCYFRTSMKHRSLYIGLFLGAALFTKDEGMLYVFYFIGTMIATEFVYLNQTRTMWRSALFALFPGLFALFLVKAQSQINDVISHIPNQINQINGMRVMSLVSFLSMHLLNKKTFLLLAAPLGFAYALLIIRKRSNTMQSVFMGLFILTSFIGMGITYLFTYLPLAFHIEFSSDRLVVHFLPIIFAFLVHMSFSHNIVPLDKQSHKRSSIIR